MDVKKLLHLPDPEFQPVLHKLSMEDIVNLIQELQEEMSYEQSQFNVLKSQLEQIEGGDPEQGQAVTQALEESQDRLTQLMARTRECFTQQTMAQEALFKVDKSEDTITEEPEELPEEQISHFKIEQAPITIENNNIDSIQNFEESTFKSEAIITNKPSQPAHNQKDKNGLKYNNGMAGGDQINHENNIDNLSLMIAPNDKGTSSKLTQPSFHSSTTMQLSSDVPNNVNTNFEHSSNLKNKTVANTPEPAKSESYNKDTNNTVLVSDNNKSSHHVTFSQSVDINEPNRGPQQQKVYTIRSMNDRSHQQQQVQKVQKAQVSSHNVAEVSEASDENVLSVSAARSLFESKKSSSGNESSVKVRRNYSLGAKDSEKRSQEAPAVATAAPRPLNQSSQAYKSASMHNLNKPNESHITAGNNLKKGNTKELTISSGNVSHPMMIKSSSGPIKSMARTPNVRTAWSQKPAPTQQNVTPQQPVKTTTPNRVQKSKSGPEKLHQNTAKIVSKNMASAAPATDQSTFQIPKLKHVETKTENHHQGKVLDEPVKVVPLNKPLPDDRVPPALTMPMTKDSVGFLAEDSVQDRITLKGWDPTPLLEDLYEIRLQEDDSNDDFVYKNIEGYMEKLPMNKKKATLLKTWKKRYFKAHDGNLYYYEVEDLDKATGCLPLGGGSVEDLGELMLGIDDGRGRYLVVRCANDTEFANWKASLDSQVVSNMTSKWVKPLLTAPPHTDKKVVVVDLGSCSVRAGILGNRPSLPQLFFPTVVGIDQETQKEYVGFECAKPEIRSKCKFIFPVRPTVKVDKFSLNLEVMPALFRYVFKNLNVDPKKHWIMFSSPANFSDKIKEEFMNMFIKTFGMAGVNIVNQSLLSLYSYNAMSGIVVDIGERLEIVPVTDGYIVEQGVSRQPYGGHRIAEALNTCFTEKRYRFFTDVEFQIVRLALEKSCFVSQNYDTDLRECNEKPEKYRKAVDLQKYDLPKGSWTEVNNDLGRFKGPEGIFNLEVWGMDNPPLQKLIQSAVQASPMDTRREMWRSIYMSGGVTMMPGFVSRLETELNKLAPSSVTVEIHASPHRYHAAYIGACALAGMGVYEQSCISANEWLNVGPPVLRKWHMY